MRAVAIAVAFCCWFLSGCGYVGPVLPPSPELPNPVADLGIVQRGDQLVITFTTPARTTDTLAIRRFSEIDLRIGPAITPFDLDRWAASATRYELPVPPPNDPDAPKPRPMSKIIPVSDWMGKRVNVLVRTAVKQVEHYSQWSNRAVIDVIPPLEPPVVEWKATKRGYLLTWTSEAGVHYAVLRQGPNEHAPAQIGTADTGLYLDSTAQWDTPYIYTVVTQKDSAESLPSKPVSAMHANTFPPEIPASITAVGGPESVEVSWSRSQDADLKGYYLYRSTDGGAFERQGDLLTLPVFSDRNVQHGKTYRYAVSAVSQKGVESDKSTVAEVAF